MPTTPSSISARPLRRDEAAVYVTETHGIPCASRTLAKLVVTGGGPPYRKAGRVVLYAPADLDAWAQAKLSPRVTSTSELRTRNAA